MSPSNSTTVNQPTQTSQTQKPTDEEIFKAIVDPNVTLADALILYTGNQQDEFDKSIRFRTSEGTPKFAIERDSEGLLKIVEVTPDEITPGDRKALIELILFNPNLTTVDELYQSAVRYQFRLMRDFPGEAYGVLLSFDRFAAEKNAREKATLEAEASPEIPASPASPPAEPTAVTTQNLDGTTSTSSFHHLTSNQHKVPVTATFWNNQANPTYTANFIEKEKLRALNHVDTLITLLMNSDSADQKVASKIIENGLNLVYFEKENNGPELFHIQLPSNGASSGTNTTIRIYPARDPKLPENGPYPDNYNLFGQNHADLMKAFNAAKERQNPN